MGPVERVGGGDDVEIGVLREALAESRGAAARRPLRAEIGRAERRRESGRDADDGIGQVDAGGVLELDRSIGQQRRLRGRRPRRLEAADVAPRDGVLVARRVDEDAAAGARVEVGEKQRDARRAGQQAADAAVRARAVAFAKRDVAVGVDEGRPLVRREERKGEGHVRAQAVVVCESDPVADGGSERGVGLADVVAALGVAGETEAQALQIEGVRGNDEVSLVAKHGDVADVGRTSRQRARGSRWSGGAPSPADGSRGIRGRASEGTGRAQRLLAAGAELAAGASASNASRRGAAQGSCPGGEGDGDDSPSSPPHAVRVIASSSAQSAALT